MPIFYQLLLLVVSICYLPKFFYEYFILKKYRGYLLKRLGFKTVHFHKGSPTIWIHGVSVGEIKASASLIKMLKEKYPLSCIIVSSVTQTGHAESKKVLTTADYHVYLPFDTQFSVNRVLKNHPIDLVLLVEGDIWPNFLKRCKKNGAKIGVISGKISKKSFSRLRWIPSFTKWYFSNIDFFCLQDELFRSRFIDLDIAPEKIRIIPNLKLDDVYDEMSENELLDLKNKYDVKDLSLVIGSSHEGEEKKILEQLIPLFSCYNSLKIFVVPRHPQRFDEVELILKKLKVPYARISTATTYVNKKIILVDSMGKLRSLYQLCTLAIVAGSFTSKVGGHNILEPLWFSTPCLFGPYMYTQNAFVRLVLQAKAGRQVEIQDLQKTTYELLNDNFKLKQMGRRGKDIFIKSSGGAQKTLDFIEKVLEKKGFNS